MNHNAIYIVALLISTLMPSSSLPINGRDSENATTRRSRSVAKTNENIGGEHWEETEQKRVDPVEVAGSRLPDCRHACRSCSPCKLVIVSSICDSLHQAETCPVAYKCMCNHKSYPVP